MNAQSVNADIRIKLTEKAVDGTIRVTASIEHERNGKTWHSTVSGQGADRKDAVADLAQRKVAPHVENIFKGALAKLDPAEPLPKADEPQTLPAASGPEVPSAGEDQPPLKETPPPQTTTTPPSSEAEPTSKPQSEPKSPDSNKEESKKPDGTAPDTESLPITDEKPKDETENPPDEEEAF